MKEACETEIKENFEIYTLKVDPFGSESYGIAIAIFKIRNDEKGNHKGLPLQPYFDKGAILELRQ